MTKAAVLCTVMMLLLSATIVLGDPPPDFTGVFWWPAPDLTGNLPGTALSITAGQGAFSYEFETTDGDGSQEYVDGVAGEQKDVKDWSEPVDYLIRSGMVTSITHSGTVGWTERWQANVVNGGSLDTATQVKDEWWAEDGGQLPVGDAGSRDDDAAGVYEKVVNIAANCGWVYGMVTVNGTGVGVTVTLWEVTVMKGTTQSVQGAYQFRNVPPGNYTVKAVMPPRPLTGQTGAVVTAGSSTEANFQLVP